MVKACILIVSGIWLAVAGTVSAFTPNARLGLSPVEGDALATVVGGCNEICVVPQPDCEDVGCMTLPDGTCYSQDDTTFQEDNRCMGPQTGHTCTLSGYGTCLKKWTCVRSDGSLRCGVVGVLGEHCNSLDGDGYTCTFTQTYSYDDCVDSAGNNF